MNQKLLIKLAIDFVMTVLFLIVMACHITDIKIHEFVGITIFILLIFHLILNRQWYLTILNGNYNINRIINITVNMLLLIMMSITLISAVFISRIVFDFLQVKGSFFARQIHVFSAYWSYILVSVHLGMHWDMIISAVRRAAGITKVNKFLLFLLRAFAFLVFIYGVQVSFDRNIGYKLIMYYSFDFWNSNESMAGFFISNLAVMGMYVCGTHYVMKFIQK